MLKYKIPQIVTLIHVSGIAPDVLWTRKNLLTHDLCYKCVIYKRKRS